MRLAHSSGARRLWRTMAKRLEPVIGISCLDRSSIVTCLDDDDVLLLVLLLMLLLFRWRFLNIMLRVGQG